MMESYCKEGNSGLTFSPGYRRLDMTIVSALVEWLNKEMNGRGKRGGRNQPAGTCLAADRNGKCKIENAQFKMDENGSRHFVLHILDFAFCISD
jgi:hypothetical protein